MPGTVLRLRDESRYRLRHHPHRRCRRRQRQLSGRLLRRSRYLAFDHRRQLRRGVAIRCRRRRRPPPAGVVGAAIVQTPSQRRRTADRGQPGRPQLSAGRPAHRLSGSAEIRPAASLERRPRAGRDHRGRDQRAGQRLQRPAPPDAGRLRRGGFPRRRAAERAVGRGPRVRAPVPLHHHRQTRVRPHLRPRRGHLRRVAAEDDRACERSGHQRGHPTSRR